jgi:hypothetical protein
MKVYLPYHCQHFFKAPDAAMAYCWQEEKK